VLNSEELNVGSQHHQTQATRWRPYNWIISYQDKTGAHPEAVCSDAIVANPRHDHAETRYEQSRGGESTVLVNAHNRQPMENNPQRSRDTADRDCHRLHLHTEPVPVGKLVRTACVYDHTWSQPPFTEELYSFGGSLDRCPHNLRKCTHFVLRYSMSQDYL